MEAIAKAAWFALALVHVMPAVVLFAPAMTERLYGVQPTGDVGILIVHRGALFLAIVLAALFAMIDPAARRVASFVVTVSVVGFLVVYARAGMPGGALRTVAIADVAALAPLAFVTWLAWRG